MPYQYPTRPGQTLRVAFVGPAEQLRDSLPPDGQRMHVGIVELRPGGDGKALRAQLDAFGPHVVVVHRPADLPTGVFADLLVPVVGLLTEDRDVWSPAALPDLADLDRMVVCGSVEAPRSTAVWRSIPLPVADRFYRPVRRADGAPQLLFVGPSTERSERWLHLPKERLGVTHVASGIATDDLERLLGEHEITLSLTNEAGRTSVNSVLRHMASGHLVITEPLSTCYGLEPGIDFIEARFREDLHEQAAGAQAFPETMRRVRIRGRAKAELFRASLVWARLVDDLFDDLRAFGSHRHVGR